MLVPAKKSRLKKTPRDTETKDNESIAAPHPYKESCFSGHIFRVRFWHTLAGVLNI